MLQRVQAGEELRVVADQVGSPTWARNIADATAHVIRQARQEQMRSQFRSEILHMAAAGATSWHGFAQAVLQRASKCENPWISRAAVHAITSRDYPATAIRPKNLGYAATGCVNVSMWRCRTGAWDGSVPREG